MHHSGPGVPHRVCVQPSKCPHYFGVSGRTEKIRGMLEEIGEAITGEISPAKMKARIVELEVRRTTKALWCT